MQSALSHTIKIVIFKNKSYEYGFHDINTVFEKTK